MSYPTSLAMRSNPLFLRNEFEGVGKWGIPLVKKQLIDLSDVSLIAYSETRSNETETRRKRGVHFFVDDFRFESVYRQPEKSLKKLAQYAFVLTPDFSTYAEMQPWRQIESVAQNRWVGAFWQSKGLSVVATLSWSGANSFEYCFEGVEKNAIVAVSTVGCRTSKRCFMRGYDAMLERVEPEAILCLGESFPEMGGDLVVVEYRPFTRAA